MSSPQFYHFRGAATMVWDSELGHDICIGQQNCSQCGTHRDLCITGHQVTISCDYWPFCDSPVESWGSYWTAKHWLQHLHGLSHWPSINGYVNMGSLDHLCQKTHQQSRFIDQNDPKEHSWQLKESHVVVSHWALGGWKAAEITLYKQRFSCSLSRPTNWG